MDFLGNFHRNSLGFPAESLWISLRILLDFRWNNIGILREFPQNSGGRQYF